MVVPHFQLVVVDLMSILAGSGEATERVFAEALASEATWAPHAEVRSVLGLPLPRALAALFHTGASLDADARRAERAHARLVRSFGEHYSNLGAVRELEGTSQALAALRTHGLRIAIVSVMPRVVTDVIMSSVDWFDRGLVDTLVTVEDVSDARPQPGLIVEAMRRTGVVDARQVIKIGDTPADLAEGTLARCGAVVGLTSGRHSRSELMRRPHTHLVDQVLSVLDVLAVARVAGRVAGYPETLRFALPG